MECSVPSSYAMCQHKSFANNRRRCVGLCIAYYAQCIPLQLSLQAAVHCVCIMILKPILCRFPSIPDTSVGPLF